jgi:hypothetical protein
MCMERGDTLSSLSDDEVGELKSAIRARDVRAAGLQEELTKRARTEPIFRHHRFVGSDEDGGFRRTSQRAERANRHSERSERSNQLSERSNQTRVLGFSHAALRSWFAPATRHESDHDLAPRPPKRTASS